MEMHRDHEQKTGVTIPVPSLDEPVEPMTNMISLERDLQKFQSAGEPLEFSLEYVKLVMLTEYAKLKRIQLSLTNSKDQNR